MRKLWELLQRIILYLSVEPISIWILCLVGPPKFRLYRTPKYLIKCNRKFAKTKNCSQDEKGWNILHHAAYSDNIGIVKTILLEDRKYLRVIPIPKNSKKKIKKKKPKDRGNYLWLSARDNCGYTPIHIASQFGSIQVFKALWKMDKTHLAGYKGRDRVELFTNCSPRNRTKDGQFCFFYLSFQGFFSFSFFPYAAIFWNLRLWATKLKFSK